MTDLRRELAEHGLPKSVSLAGLTSSDLMIYISYGVPIVFDGSLIVWYLERLDDLALTLVRGSLEHVNADGMTLLQRAVQERNEDEVAILLRNGALPLGVHSSVERIERLLRAYSNGEGIVNEDESSVIDILNKLDDGYAMMKEKSAWPRQMKYRRGEYIHTLKGSAITASSPKLNR